MKREFENEFLPHYGRRHLRTSELHMPWNTSHSGWAGSAKNSISSWLQVSPCYLNPKQLGAVGAQMRTSILSSHRTETNLTYEFFSLVNTFRNSKFVTRGFSCGGTRSPGSLMIQPPSFCNIDRMILDLRRRALLAQPTRKRAADGWKALPVLARVGA